ncbi:MAG: PepSY domain-containing protein [Candidatus Rifleibacteriota bacterium]
MNTATWVKIHGYISIFFLPLALIYAVTGALIIVNERGNLAKEKHEISLSNPSLEDVQAQKNEISKFLQQHGENEVPAGEPKFFRDELSWGLPSGLNLSLTQSERPDRGILEIRRPDLLFSLVILHRARGGRLFDYFGFAFAVSLVFMYVSGIFIFWKIKAKRIALSLTFLAGTLVTIVVIYLSL